MNTTLPISINVDDVTLVVREKGDFRVALDVIVALEDPNLSDVERLITTLFIFYENFESPYDIELSAPYIQKAVDFMYNFIAGGKDDEKSQSLKLMDWEQDFDIIVPPINAIIGQDIRGMENLHWWTFLSAYMNIRESTFADVISIRKKIKKGKKLDKEEEEFRRENPNMVNLKTKLSDIEKEILGL